MKEKNLEGQINQQNSNQGSESNLSMNKGMNGLNQNGSKKVQNYETDLNSILKKRIEAI